MFKIVTIFSFVTFFSVSTIFSQVSNPLEQGITTARSGVDLHFSIGDTSLLYDLIHGNLMNSPLRYFYNRHDSTDKNFWSIPDSTDDSLLLDMKVSVPRYPKKKHSFLITDPPYDREIPHLESMPFMDFNRVNGFFLGIATPSMVDFGLHNEFGLKGGIGYGFEDKKGQSQIAGEFRVPLATNDTATPVERWKSVPTLAAGIEYHDVTTTEDAWRTERGENAVYAFFAREDFRDYFKVEGINAYLAFRGDRKSEFRIEYQSDQYSNKPQLVYYGRWGGNKTLPPNPPISEGQINSWVITADREDAHEETVRATNIFADTVRYVRMTGNVFFLQADFSKNKDLGTSFQRYILDSRSFTPIVPGISFDTRFRMESGTGDIPAQFAQYLGGPSSLPALKNKSIAGNRLILWNTEFRFNLAMFSSFFSDNPELVFMNDFGFCEQIPADNNILQGFGDISFARIVYNTGIGIGHPSGLLIGVSWRTDQKETARFIFRFQRPF